MKENHIKMNKIQKKKSNLRINTGDNVNMFKNFNQGVLSSARDKNYPNQAYLSTQENASPSLSTNLHVNFIICMFHRITLS